MFRDVGLSMESPAAVGSPRSADEIVLNGLGGVSEVIGIVHVVVGVNGRVHVLVMGSHSHVPEYEHEDVL